MTIENLLILDTETTGLDPVKDNVIEIGSIFYNVPTQSIICQFSTLLPCDKNDASCINKISVESLKNIKANVAGLFLHNFISFYDECDYIIAHNAKFDRDFILSSNLIDFSKRPYKKWICTKNDFKWPVPKSSPLNLINISLELGVPVVSAHRALTDCQLIASCFNKLTDLKERLADALQERFLYVANVSFDNKELAKQESFSWNPDFKRWEKFLTDDEAASMPFVCYKM